MTEPTGPAPSSAASNPLKVRFDAFELDEANARLLRDGKPVAVPPTPFELLCTLVRQRGSLLSKHRLLDAVWGHQFVSDSVLKTAISDLRTLLDDDPRHPRFIETVSRRGYRFIATTTAASGVPPARSSVAQTNPHHAPDLIGRAQALSQLHRAWETACSGKRALVWVAGEPGIGKTALIEHFAASLGDVVCARGQCVELYGVGEPYLPVLEALAELCRSDATMPALLRAVAPAWLLQLPWLCTAEERDNLRRELAGASPHRMLREMGEVLDRYTEQRPLVLVTEDLHWSDRATLQLIDYLARRRGSARLMWLASFRIAEVVALDHPLNPMRHELRLHGLCKEIVLDPFSESEVADCVATWSRSLANDEAFVRALHQRTDGVPLFVASVMREVVAHAARGGDDADPVQFAGVAIPENLAAIIDHYIARLSDAQRRLLAAAAVCGVEFRVTTIADTLERDAASVQQDCEELERERLWLAAPRAREGGDSAELPYAFSHALFRQVLYERTAPSVRVQLHRSVGAALERERSAGVPVTPAELAMHFERGRETMAALRCYADAAKAALQHFSPIEGMTLTEHGLALLEQAPEGPERHALEITLATLRGASAFRALGVGIEAKSALQRAYQRLGDVPQHPMQGMLLDALGFVLCMRADYDEALAVAQRSDGLWSATKDPLLLLAATTVHAFVHMMQGRPDAARSWAERALPVIDSFDAAPLRSYVVEPQVRLLGLLGIQLLHLGLVEQARARLHQAYARAQQSAQPMARLVAIWFDSLFEVRLDNVARVGALAEEMSALVEEFALAQGRAACLWFRGWAEARAGAPRAGYRRIREGYEQNLRLGMVAGSSETLGYAAQTMLLAGDIAAARAQLDEAFGIVNTHDERIYLPQLWLIDAAIARAQGRSADAQAAVRRAIAEARAQQAPWLELLALLDLCGHDSAAAEDRQTLAALIDRLPEAIDTAALARARELLGQSLPG